MSINDVYSCYLPIALLETIRLEDVQHLGSRRLTVKYPLSQTSKILSCGIETTRSPWMRWIILICPVRIWILQWQVTNWQLSMHSLLVFAMISHDCETLSPARINTLAYRSSPGLWGEVKLITICCVGEGVLMTRNKKYEWRSVLDVEFTNKNLPVLVFFFRKFPWQFLSVHQKNGIR